MKIDKRTKAYRNRKSKGLGDTIEKVTKATGIKKAVEALFDDCGCDKRKEQLNKIFPYNQPNCLEETEYNVLHNFFKNKPLAVSINQQKTLLPIYNTVLNKKQELTNCSSCVRNMVRELERIYMEYETN